MRRNAVLIGLLTLLLGTSWVIQTAPSVAKEAHTAIENEVSEVHNASNAAVLAAAKKKRSPLTAATVSVTSKKTSYHPAVDHSGVKENHKKLATQTLNALPAGCRDNLKTFAVMYKDATRRGLGGKTTIILDGSVGDAEFVALLTHECGHVIHSNLLGSATSPKSVYKDGGDIFYSDSAMVAFWQISWKTESKKESGAQNKDYISGYAKSDAFEDFAETFAAYTLQRDMLRDRAVDNSDIAAKLQWMETYLPLSEDALGDGTARWNGEVPWDITRLAFSIK